MRIRIRNPNTAAKNTTGGHLVPNHIPFYLFNFRPVSLYSVELTGLFHSPVSFIKSVLAELLGHGVSTHSRAVFSLYDLFSLEARNAQQ